MKKAIKLLCLTALVLLSSCAARKDFIYLRDMQELEEYPVIQKHEAVIHRDDKLSIIVNSQNPELAIPFNLPGSNGGFAIAADGTVTNTGNPAPTDPKNPRGYLVDVNGNIDFPVLGKLHVEGLTRSQLTDLIKKRLIEEELIKDPMVMIDFLNFKFSVLGEVNGVGTYEVTGDRITLLEAIAMAGDLRTTARLDRIGVIRENNGKRSILFHDIRSKDLFKSPCYYLQQNDIIYVEPTRQKADEHDQRNLSRWSMAISAITTLTSLILIYTK